MLDGAAAVENSLAFLKRLDILSPNDPAISLLDIYPKELKTEIHTDT